MKAEQIVTGFSVTYPMICTYALFTDPRNISLSLLFEIGALGMVVWPVLLGFCQLTARIVEAKGICWPLFCGSLATSMAFGWWVLSWFAEGVASC